MTETSAAWGSSSSWSTGALTRVAKVLEGSSSTGMRLIVASAAPVSMLVEPGPTEAVTAQVESRSRALAYPTAVCTMACSLRPST